MNQLIKTAGFLLATALATSAWAQNGEISGQVTDVDGLPISGVEVSAGAQSATTDDGGLYSLTSVDQTDRVLVKFEKEGLATTFGVANLSVATGTDDDGDGVDDSIDECLDSNTDATIVIDGRDTGIDNTIADNGCSLQDDIFACSDKAVEAGEAVKRPKWRHHHYYRHLWRWWHYKKWWVTQRTFRRCVWKIGAELKYNGDITRREFRKLIRAAWWADLPLEHTSTTNPVNVVSSAVINKTMLNAGTTNTIDTSVENTIEQDGFKATFPAGSIDATGNVEVVITPIDVSTPALGAFPGDFEALDANDQQVLLETFSLMKVDLFQNGERVDLVTGAMADLEFLLPENTTLVAGDVIPLWFFDEDQGIWVEEGSATVGVASSDATRLSASGQVSHFTWWNCDQPIATQTSISGRVVDTSGVPVSGVGVRVSGVDYNGSSYATTDANGDYCVNVRINSVVDISGSLISGGANLTTTTIDDQPTGSVNLRCQDGGAQTVTDLVLSGLACLSGAVQDMNGQPLEGVLVQSTNGGFATTDANGQYCLAAPGGSNLTVYSAGFVPVDVATNQGEAACSDGNCTVAAALVPFDTNITTCVAGTVLRADDGTFPYQGVDVAVRDIATDIPVGTIGNTDGNGDYCIDGVPFNTDIQIDVLENRDGFDLCEDLATTNSGATGATCAEPATCAAMPTEECAGRFVGPSAN